ncbi:hypothetical protein OQA88_13329 [Cercophora sp. LCS_1]
MAKLTSENEDSWQNGIDLQSLSRNFRDAIVITHRLGTRYLWIDALCILQDSHADWVAESPKMTSIFGTAILVISAMAANHCDEGILQPRLLMRSPGLGPFKVFLASELYHEDIITQSPLSSRGWAAQGNLVA